VQDRAAHLARTEARHVVARRGEGLSAVVDVVHDEHVPIAYVDGHGRRDARPGELEPAGVVVPNGHAGQQGVSEEVAQQACRHESAPGDGDHHVGHEARAAYRARQLEARVVDAVERDVLAAQLARDGPDLRVAPRCGVCSLQSMGHFG
jgi:hypothetical protein